MRRMSRKVATVGGGLLAGVGFVLALLALALPWARYRLAVDVPVGGADLDHQGRLAVFQLDLGWWYVVMLLALLGLVAWTAVAKGAVARWAALAGLAIGVAGMAVASALAGRLASTSVDTVVSGIAMIDVRAARASGIGYGIAAPLVLALGGALLSVRTQRE
jgi:hypothetical protein